MKIGDPLMVVRAGGPERWVYHGSGFCKKRPGGIYGSGCQRPILWMQLGTRVLPVDPEPGADGYYEMHDCNGRP